MAACKRRIRTRKVAELRERELSKSCVSRWILSMSTTHWSESLCLSRQLLAFWMFPFSTHYRQRTCTVPDSNREHRDHECTASLLLCALFWLVVQLSDRRLTPCYNLGRHNSKNKGCSKTNSEKKTRTRSHFFKIYHCYWSEMRLSKRLYEGKESFLRNKDIATQKPFFFNRGPTAPCRSACAIGANEK